MFWYPINTRKCLIAVCLYVRVMYAIKIKAMTEIPISLTL